MKINLKGLLSAALLGLFVFSQSGCFALVVGAAAGAGGFAYVEGDLEKNVDESLKTAHKASLAGLKDLKMFIVKDELKLDSSVIKAQNSDGKDITINIKALTEHASKIRVRVGIFGDEAESVKVLNAIQRRM